MASKKTTTKTAAPKPKVKPSDPKSPAKIDDRAPEWAKRIAKKIDAAKLLSKSKAKVFRPVLDEAKITAFEKKLGAAVPQEYRDYLLYLGGGGYGPWSGIIPLKKAAREDVIAIWISVIDNDDQPIVLIADGPDKGIVEVWDENEEVWIKLGTFPKYFEEWVDDDFLYTPLSNAISEALKKKKPLEPELHAIVLEYQSIFDRPVAPDAKWFARIPNATLALYLGDRAKAEKMCAELVEIEQNEEKVELGAGTYGLVSALWPDDMDHVGSTDPAIFEALSKHSSAAVRRMIAWRDYLTPAALANMAEDSSDVVRGYVARHRNATAEILARVFAFSLARWKLGPTTQRLFALAGAARNPNASVAHAEEICKVHASSNEPLAPWLVRDALLHPKISTTTLTTLAKHPHPAIRQGVACHPSLPIELLETLALDSDESVRAAIAFRSDTPPEILAQLTRDDFDSVVIVVIWNEKTPIAAIVRLIAEGRSDLLVALAQRKGLPKDAEKQVKSHPWYRKPQGYDFPFTPTVMPDGRQCIASRSFRSNPAGGNHRYFVSVSSFEVWEEGAYAHPAFPVPILPAYIEEHYGNGGREMCSHPWLDDALMTTLVMRGDPTKRTSTTLSAIAQHPRLPPALREKLLPNYAESIAKNPIAEPALLEKLATSTDPVTRAAVAEHRLTPIATLTMLSKDPELTVRRGVASNASTPAAIIDALVEDENQYVRDVAAWTVNARALAP